MGNKLHFKDLELIDYKKAWDYQTELFEGLIQQKTTGNSDENPGFLLFCEHPHVFTLGKSGSSENLLINTQELDKKGISYYHINRGGDITYHGPGQLVCYPILDIEKLGIGLRKYVNLLEETVIHTLSDFRINATRLEKAPGIWIEQNRKICALGIKSSRMVTMHGLALNVNTDLSFFNLINPCGFIDKGVTSLEKELGEKIDFEAVKTSLKKHFSELFHTTFME